MKNLLLFTFATALSVTMISCGPSAEEKKADSLQLDSTKNEMADEGERMIDSINRQDSINNAIMMRVADSIRMADSMNAMKKGKK
ncbi:hypothetical protein BH11BAC7_BH11BAC7_04060 [soil metagenome]